MIFLIFGGFRAVGFGGVSGSVVLYVIIYSLYYRILLTTSVKEEVLVDCYGVGIWDCISL